MSFQDWDPIVLSKKTTTEKKPQSTMSNAQKALLNDEDVAKIKYVDRELSQQIVQARVAKGWTRKQLAQNMCIQESVVADFETGKAIHNGSMVSKFKNYLGIGKSKE